MPFNPLPLPVPLGRGTGARRVLVRGARSWELPSGAPAWLQQPRASQRGACTGPSSWQEQRQIGASYPSQEVGWP
eukprot:scaffold66870_cov54-Phaeocystis_antarctica.AAC.4